MSYKSACFDVLGTCFGFDAAIQAIHSRLGDVLRPANIDAKSLFFSWFYAAQRDFTYTSMVGEYQPIADILKQTFRRACLILDLPGEMIRDEDVEVIMAAVKALEARAGLKKCFDGMRAHGWDVYGVTNGGAETSLKYYANAGVQLDAHHMLSCDDIKKAKPDMRVYENARTIVTRVGCTDQQRWFVAAHSWDLIAASKAGFKTAYLSFEEHDPVGAVFGKFDVYATSFEDLLSKMNSF